MQSSISKELIKNTLHKEMRNKGIIFLFVFTIIFIFAGHLLAVAVKSFVDESNLTTFIANSSQGVIINFVSFSTSIVCSIIAASVVRSDLSSGVLSQVLSFPISRFKYVLSRVIGAWSLSYSFYLLSLIFGIILLAFSGNINIDLSSLLISSSLMTLQIFGLTVVGIFFSMFFNRLGAFLTTFGFYVISKIVFHSVAYEGISFTEMTVGKIFKYIIYFFTPRVAEISYIAEEFIYGKDIDYSSIVMGLSHFVVLVGIWLFLMKLLFEKREF